MRTVLLVISTTIVGCGGSNGSSQLAAVTPPDMVDSSGCHPTFGRTFIVDTFSERAQGDGFDLNGDGKPDNALGALAAFANPRWNDAIVKGYAIYLLDLDNLAGPPLVDGSTPQISFFVGVDANNDPTDNLGGRGTFYVPAEQFDVNCQTTAGFDHTMVTNGSITGDKSKVSVVAQGVGGLEFVHVKLVSTINSDYSRYSGTLGDISTACALSLTPSGFNTSSLLELIVGNFSLQPDMDLDGDGLDTFTVDANGLASCTTGSGVVITGHDCPCDPRIADGYSSAMDFTGVPATILGLTAPK